MNKKLMLQSATKLNKSEMKNVRGGVVSGTCGFKTAEGRTFYGVNKSFAQEMAADGGRWCCDSCGSASWLN